MSTGRAYIEAMLEGVADLNLSGALSVTGSSTLLGTLQYRHNIQPILADRTLTAAESGAIIVFLGNNLTASLPNGAVGHDGTANTAGGMVFHFTTLNPDNNHFRITGSAQGGGESCFVGSIVSSLSSSGVTAVPANRKLNASNAAFGDFITVVSTGDLTALGDAGGSRWVVMNSSVELASNYTFEN